MKAFWNARTPREKLLLLVAGALFAAFFFMQAVIGPIIAWKEAARLRAETAEADYRLVARAAALGGMTDTATVPVRAALNEAALANGVQLSFVNVLPNDVVEFQAADASAEAVFSLFRDLETRHAVRVVAADIQRDAGNAGVVRVQASISR